MKRLGRYEIQKELGQGAMGTVYLAHDSLLNRLVALKTITPRPGMTEVDQKASAERFFREAKAAAVLNHPNIITVYDLGRDEATGTDFIAMEYLPGQTLDQHLLEKGKLDFQEAAGIIRQAAEGLDYAHGRGIVHRDIKPSNLFLKEDGTVKIMDFGIARITEAATLTKTGAMVGTPAYMSPEQVMGQKIDSRSDIFSLGVVFYELLTGKRPFEADSFVTLAYKILNEQPEPVDFLNPLIPKRALAILEKCLEKNPDFRYQRASHLAKVLETLLSDAIQAPAEKQKAPGLPEPQKTAVMEPAIPNRRGIPVLAILLLLLTAGGLFWFLQPKPPVAPVVTPVPSSMETAPPAPEAVVKEPVSPAPAPAPSGQEKIFETDSAQSAKTAFKDRVEASIKELQALPEEERYRKVNQVINSKLPEKFKVAFLQRVVKNDPSAKVRRLASSYLKSHTSEPSLEK